MPSAIMIAMQKELDDSLEATFWLFDREPGMDDLTEGAEDILKKFKEELEIYPFQNRAGEDKLMTARYEFPKSGEEYQYPRAVFAEDACGWIHFLAGFPVDCCEMLLIIGEYTTEPDLVYVKAGTSIVAPQQRFFRWPDTDKRVFNLTALAIRDRGKIMARNIEDPKPQKAHWWFGVNLADDPETMLYPLPGEFLGLAVRMMPDKPWGRQLSSPFIYSGNFMDTVFLTSAVITEVIDPTDTTLYPTYKVKWRGKDQDATVKPSDFAEYKVDDRVTIFKDVTTEKQSQLWKDTDTENWDDVWQIIPLSFYGLERPEE